ncbi:MAG: hypothetical protein JNM21_14360 [Taibaiella sp.]|nr:hypothetical protein [Taibaiella sp.]
MIYLKKISSAWFAGMLLLVLLHQFLEKWLEIRIPVIDNYLDPLLLMPILLHLMLWERRILFKKDLHYVFSLFEVIVLFIVVSFVAEYLFPRWSMGFTADGWDVVCYACGTLIFYFFFNVPYEQLQIES